MPEMQLIDDFIIVGAFCGILIGSTLLLKNRKTEANWPLGILMIFLGLSLLPSLAQWCILSINVIFLAILAIPLFLGSYLQILLRTPKKVPRLNSILTGIFAYLLLHFAIGNPVWRAKGILFINLALGIGYFVIQYPYLSKRLGRNADAKKTDNHNDWLLAFHIVLLTYYVALLIAVFDQDIFVTTTILQGGVAMLLIGWTVALVLMPRYLYKTDRYLLVNVSLASKKATDTSTSKKRNVSYTLKDHIKKEYVEKISSYMESTKPFLRKNFTLNKLTQDLELSPTYTSRVINEVYGKNFKDYVNGFRIENACENLLNEKMKNYTIEAIAQESGFHSRTAFYNAFKRIMHMSPGEYISLNSKKAVVI